MNDNMDQLGRHEDNQTAAKTTIIEKEENT